MSDQDIVNDQIAGFELLMSTAKVVAMLPLEEWLRGLNRAESIAPIIDPTLAKEYFASDKPAVLKDIIEKAIPLKHAVIRWTQEFNDGKLKLD